MTTKAARSVPLQDWLAPRLSTPHEIVGYLEACIAEQKECPGVVFQALKDILYAHPKDGSAICICFALTHQHLSDDDFNAFAQIIESSFTFATPDDFPLFMSGLTHIREDIKAGATVAFLGITTEPIERNVHGKEKENLIKLKRELAAVA